MKKFRMAGVIFLILAVILGGLAVRQYLEEKNAGKEYDQIREEAAREPEPEEEKEPEPETTETPAKEPVEIPIDFPSLQAQNPDVYAWIQVPGTEVDYPILQSPDDNGYYLDHDINKSEAAAGAIFTENYNTKTFEDPNTVIYGHDMKNGSMFGTLREFQNQCFPGHFPENPGPDTADIYSSPVPGGPGDGSISGGADCGYHCRSHHSDHVFL